MSCPTPGAALLLSLLLVLVACDIEPVSTGQWQVEINTPDGMRAEQWMIGREGTITITRDNETVTTEVELAGSRVSWSLAGAATEPEHSANFAGTVSGNSLGGTLYTQQGNFSVRGARL